MGTDAKTKSSDSSGIKPLAEYDPDKETFQTLDERDMIEPLNEAPPEEGDQQEDTETETPGDEESAEHEITLEDGDNLPGGLADGDETEIDINSEGQWLQAQEDPDETQDLPSEEPIDVPQAMPEEQADESDPPDDGEGEVQDDVQVEDGSAGEDDSSEKTSLSVVASEKDEAGGEGEDDFVSLTDENVDDEADEPSEKKQPPADAADAQGDSPGGQEGESASENKDPHSAKNSDAKKLTPLKTAMDNQKAQTPAKGSARTRKIVAAAAIILMIAGYTIYNNPSAIGLGREIEAEIEPERESDKEIKPAVEPVATQVQAPGPGGKNQPYLSKINEAVRLREKLLAKKEEIYRLMLHYRNGIIDLQEQISSDLQETGISTLDQALKNRRIELNLRTIQRRQNYIRELEKPDQWVHRGSEELLFLKRKAELDLQMADVASGIDMDRHVRYINSAIQKYQPSAEKLAVDPLPMETTPLETIWDQIIRKQAETASIRIGTEDQRIISEICSGDFKRIAELSAITPEAARCLSRVNSSDLFLNGLIRLTTEDAKYLSRWQGNWICLNGIKELSPAVARHLFKWEGNWISLNGLTDFPPELAVYLMEWKGDQLELMGLQLDKSRPDRKTLKYLTLWETMGGKLYVSDGIRKEMNQVM